MPTPGCPKAFFNSTLIYDGYLWYIIGTLPATPHARPYGRAQDMRAHAPAYARHDACGVSRLWLGMLDQMPNGSLRCSILRDQELNWAPLPDGIDHGRILR